jgi:hypothetical protein
MVMPLIELAEKEEKVPDLKFLYSIKVNPGDFIQAMKEMDVVGESVVLTGEPNMLRFSAKGDLNEADKSIKGTSSGTETKSKFSIEYLGKLPAVLSLFSEMKISLGKDYPVLIELDDSRINWKLILAPRVDND